MKRKVLLLCTVFVLMMSMLTAVPASAAPTNLITDGGFEAASIGVDLLAGPYWMKRSQCTAKVTGADARTGTKSALMTPIASTTSGGTEGLFARSSLAITKEANLNEWYILESYQKAASATPATGLAGKIALRISGAKLLQSAQYPLNNTTWTRCYLTFQATEANFVDGFKAVFGIHQVGTAGGEAHSVYIDDISVHVIPAAQVQKPAGAEIIDIPTAGSIAENYTTTVLNEFGENKVSQRPTWSLQTPYAGVSINETTGVLTVTSAAQAGTVKVVASQDGVTSDSLSVELKAPIAGPSYNITVNVNDGGSVKVGGKTITSASSSSDKVTAVAQNGSVTMEFSPNVGYSLSSVLYGSQDKTGELVDNKLTFSNITANETVTVSFEQDSAGTKTYAYDTLFQAGKNLTIGYLGGSITQGSGAPSTAYRWSSLLTSNFFNGTYKTKYNTGTAKEVNAGVGGTPSSLGLFRLANDISYSDPDIVFVEFAVNDSGSSTTELGALEIRQRMEGIVRQLQKLPKQPVVIFIYTAAWKSDTLFNLPLAAAALHEEVASHYGIGSINLCEYVAGGTDLDGNAIVWNKDVAGSWTGDNTHPNQTGYQKYAQYIQKQLNDHPEKYFKRLTERELPKFGYEFGSPALVAGTTDRATYSAGDWQSGGSTWPFRGTTDKLMYTTKEGATANFSFTGRSIGLFALRGDRGNSAAYTVKNDEGQTVKSGTINNFYRHATSYNSSNPNGTLMPVNTFLVSGLPFDHYTLELTTNPITVDQNGYTKDLFTIGYYMVDEAEPSVEAPEYVPPTPPISETNLITDGGFEVASVGADLLAGTYWTKRSQCTGQVTGVAAKTGTKSALMTPIASTTSGGTEGLFTKSSLPITKEANLNEWYIVESYQKAASATPATDLMGKVALRISGAKLLQSTLYPLSNTTWTRCYLTFQAIEANFVDGFKPIFGIHQVGTYGGEAYSVYIDDISVRVIPAAQIQKPAGAEIITIPTAGSIAESYTTAVLNEFGNNNVSQRPKWSLQTAYAGVSINETTGVLTVTSAAQAGTVNVVASQDGVTSNSLSVELKTPIAGPSYNITVNINDGGSVKVGGKTITATSSSTDKVTAVAENGSITMEFSPNVGYKLSSVLYGSQDKTGELVDNKLTFSNITANETVTITFEKDDTQVNLFQNGGFEAGVATPFLLYGPGTVISADNSVARTGTYSLKSNVTTTTQAYPLLGAVYKITNLNEFDITKTYTVSAWVKTDQYDRKMLSYVWYRKASGSVQKTIATKAITAVDGWTEITFTLDPSKDITAADAASLVSVDIAIGCEKTNPNGSFWMDDVSLTYQYGSVSDLTVKLEGNKLVGSYAFVTGVEQIEKDSAYRFLKASSSDAPADQWQVMASGICTASQPPEYTLKASDYNSYYKLEVTPKAEDYVGKTVSTVSITGAFAPEALNVAIDGTGVVGRTLTGTYQYTDKNSDIEAGSTYRWLSSSTVDGTYQPISGATSTSYVITNDQEDRYIKFEVTPKNASPGGDAGVAAQSDALLVSGSNQAPAVSNVTVSGSVAEGSLVSGNYTFTDSNGDKEGESVYQWYVGNTAQGTFEKISEANAKTFSIPSIYTGKYIQFEVTPKDEFGLVGQTVKSPAVLVEGKKANYLIVAPDGDDANDGTLAKPLKTLEGARDRLRQWKTDGKYPATGVTVYLRGGEYELSKTFALDGQDSGTDGAPVLYRPYGDEKVSITGGKKIDFSKFSPVTGDMKNKLRSVAAQGKVVVSDISALGLTDFPEYTTQNTTGVARYNLYSPLMETDGKKMALARYPNSDYRTGWVNVLPTAEAIKFDISFTDPVISTWTHNTSDIWYLGYWKYEWAAEFLQGTLDTAGKKITNISTIHYGSYKKTRPMRVYNVYEEIDEPGEWYYDKNTKKLYLYPIEGTTKDSTIRMTSAEFELITIKNASNITIKGFDITGGNVVGVNIADSINCFIDSCDIHLFQKRAVSIGGVNSKNNGIQNSRVYSCGEGGLSVSGGDSSTITPSSNFARNNEVFDFSLLKDVYSPGLSVSGVGNILAQNEVYNSPHQAVSFGGQENIMEYNTFQNVCKNAADMGVFYTGRNMASQGNIIRYNHFKDIGDPNDTQFYPCAVFTDDGSSNMEVYGNIVGPGVEHAQSFKAHGGILNKFYNNLTIEAPIALYQAGWTYKNWYDRLVGDAQTSFRDSFNSVKNNQVYLDRYPYLKELKESATSATSIKYLNEFPNRLEDNVFLFVDLAPNATKHIQINPAGTTIPTISSNLILQKNPELYKSYFKDWDKGNYSLTDQAYTKIRETIPDFPTIPFEAMGRGSVANQLPVAKDVKIYRGSGNVLAGSYLYEDAERDLEGATVIRWYVGDTDTESAYQLIAGANALNFTYPPNYSNKYIRMEIVPVDASGREGKVVRSQAVRIVTDWAGLLEQIQGAQAKVDGAVAGTGLGQYPASAIQALKDGIAAAQSAYNNPGSLDLATVVEALDKALFDFAEARVKTFADSSGSGTVNIPSDLQNMKLDFTNVTGTITLKGDTLPTGVINAVINGKKISVDISSSVTLPNGEFTIKALENSSAEDATDVSAAFVLGKAGETYSPAMTVTVEGATGKLVSAVENGKLVAISGLTNVGQDLQFPLSKGNEFVIYGSVFVSSDSSLSSLSVNGTDIPLTAGKTNYSIQLEAGTKTAEIEAIATHNKATVVVPTVSSLPAKNLSIVVTAQDGTKTTYTLSITVKVAPPTETADPTPTSQPTYHPNPIYTGSGGGSSVGSSGRGDVIKTPDTMGKSSFQDIIGHWAEADIEAMYVRDVVSGITEFVFEPDRAVTRAEFATMVVKTLQLTTSVETKFDDVETGSWYVPYVNAAASAGLITGYAGTFRPDDLITREEMAVVLSKAYFFMQKPVVTGEIEQFDDRGDISEWAYASVDTATSAGLIRGITGNYFGGWENTTRAQAVSVLKRLLDL